MSLFSRARRLAGASFLIVGLFVVVGAVFVAATNRAGAASIIQAVTNSITCSSTGATPCFNVTNTSSGVAVYGTSKSGTGLRGLSTSNYGLKATSSSGEGVFGQSTSGTAGVAGSMANGIGVYGYTTGSGGTGVLGTSASVGVYGSSSSGSGVEGFSADGDALEAVDSGSGTGLYVSTNTGYGVISYTDGNVPMYARNANGNGSDVEGTYIGLLGRAPASGGFPLTLTDETGANLFYVDGAGNVSYHGGLYTFARTQGGGSAMAFSTKTTAPTIEDTGTAQLVGGASSVRLDATFASSIDTGSAYRVFVTPHGDSRGLYVASESAAGFVVRESQGGRSSMSFDYRIVAAPLGHARERMAMVGRDSTAAAPRAPMPAVPSRPRLERTVPARP